MNDGKHCALCNHEITFDRCGYGEADDKPLCHTDDHSCYHCYTVYGERPKP